MITSLQSDGYDFCPDLVHLVEATQSGRFKLLDVI